MVNEKFCHERSDIDGEKLVSEVVPKALALFVQADIGVTTSLIVVCRRAFRYCYAFRLSIWPRTRAKRLLRQAQTEQRRLKVQNSILVDHVPYVRQQRAW